MGQRLVLQGVIAGKEGLGAGRVAEGVGARVAALSVGGEGVCAEGVDAGMVTAAATGPAGWDRVVGGGWRELPPRRLLGAVACRGHASTAGTS